MINDLKLRELEQRFKEKSEKVGDTNEMYDLYESFYQWLNGQKDCSDELIRVKYTLLYKALRWFDSLHIREKDLSKHWNKSLVKRIVSSAEKEKQYIENGRGSSDEAKIDRELWMNELKEEMDFATVVYCYRILEKTEVITIPSLLSLVGSSNKQSTLQAIKRPRIGSNSDFIMDDGRKYWHAGAKELMTYDECTERGLKHYLLAYASGDLKGLFVGFDEPDSCTSTKKDSEESTITSKVVSID